MLSQTHLSTAMKTTTESRREPVATETLTVLASDARWRAPEIDDRGSFLVEHPECLVTEGKLAELNLEIGRRAAYMFRQNDELTREDIESDVVAGILECATHYRELGDDGQPIFDFLDQAPSYIVRHAAGRVSSELRRQRDRAKVTSSYDAPRRIGTAGDGGVGLLATIADTSAAVGSARVELLELTSAVEARCHDTTTRRVWYLILIGYDRAEIGQILGLRRQRVAERFNKLRDIIAEIEPSAVATGSRLGTHRATSAQAA